jgi:AmmeMemoRadiSam system protein B/AmmeMemoRadiSam system protein A
MMYRRFLVLAPYLLVLISSCSEAQHNRQPAVAGQFYPSDRKELEATLRRCFSRAVPRQAGENVLAVIAPHAGYVYSGETAASAFNQVDPDRAYDNIFVLGPSHHVGFEGASIYASGDFVTPLGTVKVNRQLADSLIGTYPFFSSREDAHRAEHSVEVQIPFLQYLLKKPFRIVPIVIGGDSPEMCGRIAGALRPFLRQGNLFVVSTDFSHYPSYDDAVDVDRRTAEAVVSNSPAALIGSMNRSMAGGISNLATCMCGWSGVLTLLSLTEKNPEYHYRIVRYRNSGDAEVGNKGQVVGYYAIAVSTSRKHSPSGFRLETPDKRELLRIARSTVEDYVKNRHIPAIDPGKISRQLTVNCGAFVTLHEHGDLRGCIGRFGAEEPLYKVVQQMAVAASTEDYRFSPVQSGELSSLEIEISVLTPMRKISSIDEIVPGTHGIYIRKGERSGTFLPQVATETGWSREELLGHCARDKAGIGWDGWKGAEIFVYEALVFSEKELHN